LNILRHIASGDSVMSFRNSAQFFSNIRGAIDADHFKFATTIRLIFLVRASLLNAATPRLMADVAADKSIAVVQELMSF
jgi:hypothetical protein